MDSPFPIPRVARVALVLAALAASPACDAEVPAGAPAPSAAAPVAPLPEAGFDEAADPAADLEAAKAVARASGRRILVKVGGNWCVWCRLMTKFFRDDAEVARTLEQGFVLLKVNVSKANKNEAFLAGYPKVEGYPYLFVLDADGTRLHAQETGALESGQGYDREKFLGFLRSWAPRASG